MDLEFAPAMHLFLSSLCDTIELRNRNWATYSPWAIFYLMFTLCLGKKFGHFRRCWAKLFQLPARTDLPSDRSDQGRQVVKSSLLASC